MPASIQPNVANPRSANTGREIRGGGGPAGFSQARRVATGGTSESGAAGGCPKPSRPPATAARSTAVASVAVRGRPPAPLMSGFLPCALPAPRSHCRNNRFMSLRPVRMGGLLDTPAQAPAVPPAPAFAAGKPTEKTEWPGGPGRHTNRYRSLADGLRCIRTSEGFRCDSSGERTCCGASAAWQSSESRRSLSARQPRLVMPRSFALWPSQASRPSAQHHTAAWKSTRYRSMCSEGAAHP